MFQNHARAADDERVLVKNPQKKRHRDE